MKKLKQAIAEPKYQIIILIITSIILSNYVYLFTTNSKQSFGYRWLIQPMYNCLNWTNQWLNLTVAVVTLTIIVRIILFPLNIYASSSNKFFPKFLLVVLQLPFLSAVYFVTTHSDLISQNNSLAKPNATLALCVAFIYLINNIETYGFAKPHHYYDHGTHERILAMLSPIFIYCVCSNLASSASIYLLTSAMFTFFERNFRHQ